MKSDCRAAAILAAMVFALSIKPGKVLAAIDGWTNLGPEGGPIHAISIDPRDPNTLHAGTEFASFVSENAGSSWVKSALPNANLVFHPQDPDIVYARPRLNYLGPLLNSTDHGKTWTDSGPPRLSIVDFVVSRQNPNTMFVATSEGVFKSSDGAKSWHAVNGGLTSLYAQTLALHPQNPDIVYVGTRAGVFKTTDGGNTWNVVKEGVTGFALAIDPQNPDTIYVAPHNEGVSRSTDGGKTWTMSSQPPAPPIWVLMADPQDPDTIYACCAPQQVESGLWKSVDGGETWADTGLKAVRSFTIDPDNSATIYAGTDAGAFKSVDGGKTWRPINSGLMATAARTLAVDRQNPDTVYAALRLLGTKPYKSTDGGISWTAITGLKGDTTVLEIDPKDSQTIYSGGWDGLFKSTDGGASWKDMGLAVSVTALAVDPRNPGVIYAGRGDSRLSKSVDGGRTWITPEFSFKEFEPGTGHLICSPVIAALAIVPKDTTILYAATSDCNDQTMDLWRSKDGGTTWSRMKILVSGQRTILAVDPEDPDTVYAGQPGGVARSTNGGETWTLLKSGLPGSFSVLSVAVDPQSPSILYAMGYDYSTSRYLLKVFKSTDRGSSWMPFGNVASDFFFFPTLDIVSRGYNTLYASATSGLHKTSDNTPQLSVSTPQYCTGDFWELKVANGAPNTAIRLAGTSNGQSWEVRDWRDTDGEGQSREAGVFAAGTEGRHYLMVEIGGAFSNIVSFVVSDCRAPAIRH